MPTVALSNQQILDLVKQLPPDQKFSILLSLAENSRARREANMQHAEAQLRMLAKEKGLNWDGLTDDERLALVDELVHESR
jgi:hypothetical protein